LCLALNAAPRYDSAGVHQDVFNQVDIDLVAGKSRQQANPWGKLEHATPQLSLFQRYLQGWAADVAPARPHPNALAA
jgi:hypothetical protein